MIPPRTRRLLLARLGELLTYPDDRLGSRLDAAESLAPGDHACAEALASFRAEISDATTDALGEVYTRTFDVAPVCIPYLSIHLFGEESFRRARLMTGLSESLAAAGVALDGELPDHLAVVLRAAPALTEELWEDLLEYVLRAAVHAMDAALAETPNPYRWPLRAVASLVGPATAEDLERLAAARREREAAGRPDAAGAACGGR
ncbi:MAG: hypothetical protein EP329_02870 [Deltaproteobacteria bacterium]|nr:MAG: hypothetical protein EP329_02870 [Deltaproteobacteria bacterium]